MLSIDNIEQRRSELIDSINVIDHIAHNIPHNPEDQWYYDLVIQIGLLKYGLNLCLDEFKNKI